MVRPQVADQEDDLRIWRTSANVLNKQFRTADQGWSSSLWVGRGANNASYLNRTMKLFGHAASGTVGSGTALQTGSSRVRFPMVSLEFFMNIILPAALWPWC
jgi:hypothetical protein